MPVPRIGWAIYLGSLALRRRNMAHCVGKTSHHLFVQVHGRLPSCLAAMNVVKKMGSPDIRESPPISNPAKPMSPLWTLF